MRDRRKGKTMMFVSVLLIVLWVLGVGGLVIGGIEVWEPLSFPNRRDPNKPLAIAMWVAALLLFCGGVALIASDDEDDPNAHRLCRRGHQEWRTEYHPPMMVGKVMMPSRTDTRKVWICDEWEQ